MTVGALRLRIHGSTGPHLIVLHGGPAAAGDAVGLAEGLSDSFRVLEPWQRGSGAEPLTVAIHIADLHALIGSWCADAVPAIVGESWGAMLALAYAAAHPDSVAAVVLLGCGTFDPNSRARLEAVLAGRTSEALREQLKALTDAYPDPSKRLMKEMALTRRLYSYAPIGSTPDEDVVLPFDLAAHSETWTDMLRLQAVGVYPAAFARITAPVLMLHGDYDPSPGAMIRASLEPYLRHLEYRTLERCGHFPWVEQFAREKFFAFLREWLTHQLRS